MKNRLYLPIGLPRSGKSTWARSNHTIGDLGYCAPIVNPDSIRQVLHGTTFRANVEPMVWAIAHTMVESLFAAGHTEVILDACNHTARRRQEWVRGDWECVYVKFDTDVSVCEARAIETNQDYLIPIIRRMSKEISWPYEGIQPKG